MLRHKGLLSLLSLLFAVLLVPAARADVDSHARIVRLSYAEGQVQIAHRNGIGYENATMNLPVDTLSDEIEPYLLREQFIVRTGRGRLATPRAYQHLGRPTKLVVSGRSAAATRRSPDAPC